MRDLWGLVLLCLTLAFLFGWLVRSLLAGRKLERLRSRMDQTEAELTGKEAELLMLGNRIDTVETELKDIMADRDRLRVCVMEQGRELQLAREEGIQAITRQEEAIKAKQAEIETLTNSVHERGAEVARLKGALEEMARIADSNGDRGRDLDELRRRLASRDEEVARLSRFVQALEPLSSQLSEAERALTTAVEGKNAEITRLTNQVAHLESALSGSSRPTSPVPVAPLAPPPATPLERRSDAFAATSQLQALMESTRIEFRDDSADLSPVSSQVLDSYSDLLRAYIDLPVEITGHTDNTGEFWHSYELSRWRARAVKEYLVGKGVPAERLSCHGCGMTRPMGDNATPSGRRANNRIEFRICTELISARMIARGGGMMAAGA